MKRFLFGVVVLLLASIFTISCYGMGEDLLDWLPLWLTKLALGFIAFCIIIVVVLILTAGVIKIKEIIKGE